MKRDKLKSLTLNLIPNKKKDTKKIKQKLKTGLKNKGASKGVIYKPNEEGNR